ncbi:hypothetical protein JHD46_07195, partial [Sulfurimonas sp. SAG-AH-194-C20]
TITADETATTSDTGTVEATDITALDAETSGVVVLAAGLNDLTGTIAEVQAAFDANDAGTVSGLDDDETATVSDTGTVAALDITNLDAETSGVITLNAGISTLTGTIVEVQAAFDANTAGTVTGLDADEAVTTSDTTATATSLNDLNTETTGVIDATSVDTIDGISSDIQTVIVADTNGEISLSDSMTKLQVTDDNNDLSGIDWSNIGVIGELDFSGVGTSGIDQNLIDAFDTINGSGGSNTLTGSSGADTFSFSGTTLTSIEEVDMLAGDDTVTLDFSQVSDIGVLNGGADTDTADIASGIDLTSASQSIADGSFTSIEAIDLSGAITDGANTFDITQSNIDAWTDLAGSGDIALTISSTDNTNQNIKLVGTTDADGASADAVTDRVDFVSGETYNWDVDTTITFTIV